jgi:hypothetical protein
VQSFETPILLFTSDTFSVGGDESSGPLGKDTAEFFGAQLASSGVRVKSLVEATEGWELDVVIKNLSFLLFVHWVPIAAKDHWVLQIRQPALRKVLSGVTQRDSSLGIAIEAISGAIAERTEMKGARWITEEEFRGIY